MRLRTNLLKFWKDPVWSKVIAAGILGVLSYASYQAWPQLQSLSSSLPLVAALGVFLASTLLLLLWWYSRRTPKTLVFLSSGGTCRDPIAKAITTKLLETRKLKHRITIHAVGLGPLSKPEVSYAARYVIKEMYNEDLLANHKPEILTAELVQEADLILAMDKSLLLTPGKTLPTEKTFLLTEFLGIKGDVSDPWPDGKDPATLSRYRKCADELRQILTQNLDRLVRVLDL